MKKVFVTIFIICCLFTLKAQDISDTLHVVHYDLNLDFTDFSHHMLNGAANLTVVTKTTNLPQYTFDLQGLTVDSVYVNATISTFNQVGNKVMISHISQQGDTAIVRICYHGTPVSDSRWGGFYYSGQYCYNMGVAFDYQPHNFGRCWFPCLDVFTDKSSYTMHVRTEAGKMAVCGGMLTDSLTLSDSTRIWTWQLDEPIPTYLASVAVGPYQLYADTYQGLERNIPIHIYAQPNSINNVAGSFVNLKEILRLYEQLFGPYRWPRVGYVAVNFTSGAMEHATSIAYPNLAINGNTTNELLYAHELFHHWFGDLITCNRAEEMWINEGFASYSEALVSGLPDITPDADGYLDYIRDVHFTTLKDIVKDDGGHYALDNVPQNTTYGTHSYQKGELILHTLRNYMGDSLFFSSMRALLNQYAFQNINSEQLFTFLSQVSGMDLMDFYQGWVHEPGFPHFSIDSIVNAQNGNYRVYLHQKRLGGTQLANSNKLDLTFVSEGRQLFTVANVPFSGELGTVDVNIPFVPVFGMIDYYEKMTDAIIDHTLQIADATTASFSDAYFTYKLESFPDTVLLRVEHNMVSPDQPIQLPEGIYRISDNHYWNINMAYRQDINTIPMGQMQFRYQSGAASSPDHDLLSGYNKDNLKLLYRANVGDEWQIIASELVGSNNSGSLRCNQLRSGQYCLAVGNPTASVNEYLNHININIRPNPVENYLHIWADGISGNNHFAIYDTAGRIVKTVKLKDGENEVNVSNLPAGNYFLGLKDKSSHKIIQRFIKL